MYIGSVIKLERLRQEMKQETLARGICSIAHLSRIENGNSIPSNKILNELLERLGIPQENVESSQTKNNPINMDEIIKQYEGIINKRNKNGANQLIAIISDYLKTTSFDNQLRIDLDLIMLRLHLMDKSKSSEIVNNLRNYKEIESALSPTHIFQMNMILGIANYQCGDLIESLEAFSMAHKTTAISVISPFDRGDFSYAYSVALIAVSQNFEALEQAKYALDYFKSNMLYQRVVECLLICGVAYRKMEQLEKSIYQFREAEHICKEFQLESYIGIVYQNLGEAYSTIGDIESAIDYYKKSLSNKNLPDEKIYTILSLLKVYTKVGKFDTLGYWLQEGYRVLPRLSRNKKVLFEKHLNVYKALYSKNNVKIESELLCAYKYFYRHNKTNQMKEYAQMLAEYYTRIGKYKNAVNYYKRIIE